MAVTTSPRPGQDNATGDTTALYLKIFGGEIVTEFQLANQFLATQRKKTMTSGKTATFPAIGKATAVHHEVGDNILSDAVPTGASGTYLNQLRFTELTIHVDRMLIAPAFLPSWDELVVHWESRREVTRELGRALAKKIDLNIMRKLWVASQNSTARYNLAPVAYDNQTANSNTDTSVFITEAFLMAQDFDEKEIPEEDRFLAVPPSLYNLLILDDGGAQGVLLDKDYSSGNGDFAKRKVYMLAGFELIKTNRLPTGATDSDDSNMPTGMTGNDYSLNGANLLTALGWHRSAMGTAIWKDVAVEKEYMIEYQADLVVAKIALGHGILQPEAIGAVRHL